MYGAKDTDVRNNDFHGIFSLGGKFEWFHSNVQLAGRASCLNKVCWATSGKRHLVFLCHFSASNPPRPVWGAAVIGVLVAQ